MQINQAFKTLEKKTTTAQNQEKLNTVYLLRKNISMS